MKYFTDELSVMPCMLLCFVPFLLEGYDSNRIIKIYQILFTRPILLVIGITLTLAVVLQNLINFKSIDIIFKLRLILERTPIQ